MDIYLEPGDIFFVDSIKFWPKTIKFFQTAPTIWHYLWRKIFNTQESVLFYHVGMLYDKTTIIEQQGTVIKRPNDKLLTTSNRVAIFRLKNLSDIEQEKLIYIAENDLGFGYDIINIIGKFLTWLTGMKFFARHMEMPNKEICINRVASWYKKALCEHFGVQHHSELTTHTLYKYLLETYSDWECIYDGIPKEDKINVI